MSNTPQSNAELIARLKRNQFDPWSRECQEAAAALIAADKREREIRDARRKTLNDNPYDWPKRALSSEAYDEGVNAAFDEFERILEGAAV